MRRTDGLSVLVVDDEPLARRRLIRLLRQISWVGAVDEAMNVPEALDKASQTMPDIMLLDIQMPGGTGFDLLDRIRVQPPAIIFVSAFSDQALRAFDANAVDYVTKPIDPVRFFAAMERAGQTCRLKTQGEKIKELEEVIDTLRTHQANGADAKRALWVKSRNDHVRIPFDAIRMIVADRDYVHIHSASGTFHYHENLAALQRILPQSEFLRIHRSAIVRLASVERVKTGAFSSLSLMLDDGEEVRVGRTYGRAVRAILTS